MHGDPTSCRPLRAADGTDIYVAADSVKPSRWGALERPTSGDPPRVLGPEFHAVPTGEDTTLCGLSLRKLKSFHELAFAATATSLRCDLCDDKLKRLASPGLRPR